MKKTCKLSDFMKSVDPWLSENYIRRAYINDQGHFVLMFKDNIQNTYEIDDCNESQIKKVLMDLKEKGVPIGVP
ncbi:MAG: hypothetical protein K9L30_05755 [Desulfobacterales bacterium]|nr:hypothetical protein [Desulfobacterales bacterium]